MSLGHDGKGFSARLLTATTSTDIGTRIVLDRPVSDFGFQVVAASTTATVTLSGSVATSSDATLTTIATFAKSSDASGTTLWITGKPAMQIAATLTAGASSGGASAWVVGRP